MKKAKQDTIQVHGLKSAMFTPIYEDYLRSLGSQREGSGEVIMCNLARKFKDYLLYKLSNIRPEAGLKHRDYKGILKSHFLLTHISREKEGGAWNPVVWDPISNAYFWYPIRPAEGEGLVRQLIPSILENSVDKVVITEIKCPEEKIKVKVYDVSFRPIDLTKINPQH